MDAILKMLILHIGIFSPCYKNPLTRMPQDCTDN